MFKVNNLLTIATADPYAIFVFDEVSKITNLKVQPVLCRADDIIEAINEYYKDNISVDDIMDSMDASAIEIVQEEKEKEVSQLTEIAEGSPVN